jgi:hypothetical protein
LITDSFNGNDLLIAGSRGKNFIVAFKPKITGGVAREYTAVQNSLPVIMQDDEGTRYDVFGRVVDGPGKGENLSAVTQFMGYWFAWAAFILT